MATRDLVGVSSKAMENKSETEAVDMLTEDGEEEQSENEDFGHMNLFKLFRLRGSKMETIRFLQFCNIIPREKNCPKCGNKMKISARETWRCDKIIKGKKGKKRCKQEISIKKHTFFSRSKLLLNEILELTYMMLQNYKMNHILRELNISTATFMVWKMSIRRILSTWASQNVEPIGGEGKVVEVYESKVGRRKQHVTEDKRVFGGIERGSGRVFLMSVQDPKMLKNAIKEWVLPGTTIVSDFWKAYQCQETEVSATKRNVTFGNETMAAHVNQTDATQQHAKDSFPRYFNKRKNNFYGFFSHYMFSQYCSWNKIDIFETFLRETAKTDYDLTE